MSDEEPRDLPPNVVDITAGKARHIQKDPAEMKAPQEDLESKAANARREIYTTLSEFTTEILPEAEKLRLCTQGYFDTIGQLKKAGLYRAYIEWKASQSGKLVAFPGKSSELPEAEQAIRAGDLDVQYNNFNFLEESFNSATDSLYKLFGKWTPILTELRQRCHELSMQDNYLALMTPNLEIISNASRTISPEEFESAIENSESLTKYLAKLISFLQEINSSIPPD